MQVDCANGEASDLGPASDTTCYPVMAAALNKRALALRTTDLGAATESVDLALAQEQAPRDVRGLSLYLRAGLAYEASDARTALDMATTYLSEGHTTFAPEMRTYRDWASGEIAGAAGTP